MATFISRLRQLREEQDLTQRELGQRFRLSKQAISTYETGGSSPDKDALGAMADFFKVSVDYLLGRTDERQPSQVREGAPTWLSEGAKNLTPEELEEWRGYADWLRARRKSPTPGG